MVGVPGASDSTAFYQTPLIPLTRRVQEILSAKMQPRQLRATQDRANLAHYQRIPSSSPEIGIYAFKRFGHSPVWHSADRALVKYAGGVMDLTEFRSTYLSRVVVDELDVKPVTPAPFVPGGIQTVATEPQLKAKVIELIKEAL